MQGSSELIVITGIGLITPLGLTPQQTWAAVLRGQCGMGPMSAMESALPDWADGGQAPDLPEDFAPNLPREARYTRRAVLDAMADAHVLDRLPCPSDRAGILLGTTLHGMRAAGRYFRGQAHALIDFSSASVISNACGDLPFRGCAMTTCSACSSSLGAVALAVTMLRSGQLDLVVAGGYDAISEYVWGGFNSLRLVAPGKPRPFVRGRQGMKLAEGYAIVVLERWNDAMARGARAFATVLGQGESADAHHLTQPHPQGVGAARAMRQALASAELTPADIDLIAAHATGTPDNDASEFAALSGVFGPELPRIPVVGFKSHLGHTLGGAGAVELILSARTIQQQIVPACATITAEEVEFAGLNVATGSPRPARIRATLNTSLGFGGANTCVVLGPAPTVEVARSVGNVVQRRDLAESATVGSPLGGFAQGAEHDSAPGAKPQAAFRHVGRDPIPPAREVLITGIGILLPGAIGNEAFLRRHNEGGDPIGGEIAESDIAPLLSARRVRRMSQYVKLSLSAAMLCLRDAGIDELATHADSCAALLGTTHGSSGYCEQYYSQIVREGVLAANPMLFAEGVPNAAAAHLSLMLGLHGPCQTVIGSRTAGLDAIRLAAARIASGEWERALVGAAEEFSPTVNAAHARQRDAGPERFVVSAGAVTMLLESRSAMESRGGRARGFIQAASGGVARGGAVTRLIRNSLRTIGSPQLVVGSADGTWIDRAERAGASRATAEFVSRPAGVAECYSIVPMAAIVARMLQGAPLVFGALATDPAGAVTAISCGTGFNPWQRGTNTDACS